MSEEIQEEDLRSKILTIPLWEDKWPQVELQKKLRSIGTKRFNMAYRNMPTDLSDLTFPHFLNCVIYGRKPEDRIPKNAEFYGGVDISSSRRPGTIIFSYAYDRQRDKRIVWKDSVKIGAWKGPDLKKRLIAEYERFNHKLINVENNSVQQAIFEFLKENKAGESRKRMPLKAFQTTYKTKGDSTLGLETLDVEFENNKWEFLAGEKEHSAACTCTMCKIINQFSEHPNYTDDDIPMAAWFADRALRTRRGTPRIRFLR